MQKTIKAKNIILITILSFFSIVAILAVDIFLLGEEIYTDPTELFESVEYNFVDYKYDFPNRDGIPLNEIATLPMGDYMVMYISYICDSKETDYIRVVFHPFKIENGRYMFLPDSTYQEASKFENKKSGQYNASSFHELDYVIIPANSDEINNYDPEIYSFVNANYTDSKGVEQDVIFCYTYKINWKLGDGSVPDKFGKKIWER